jgi:hypothetical protein
VFKNSYNNLRSIVWRKHHFVLCNNLLTRDEAYFHLSGFVNKQNFRFWSAINHIELHKRPFHSCKVTVWCAISSFGIIGSYFFEDEREKAVTVTGPRYVHMLQNFLGSELARHPVAEETFPTRWSYESQRTRFHSSCEEFVS